MAISLTPAAAERVRHFLAERGHGVGLRLAIRKTGCSGYAYVVNYADPIEPGDKVFDSQGVRVLVDARSLELIDGTEVDFVRHGLNEAFRFRNPTCAASAAAAKASASDFSFRDGHFRVRRDCRGAPAGLEYAARLATPCRP